MFLVIDNYDSFTYNLVQYLGELSSQHPIASEVRVERNDALTISEIKDLNPDAILLSPGPGDPNHLEFVWIFYLSYQLKYQLLVSVLVIKLLLKRSVEK